MENRAIAVTVDQLTILLEVVESGGFTAAARTHRRTQGAVSYHIARLEEQLGVQLFERSSRRPVLTEAGETTVGHSRVVINALNELVATAQTLESGVEALLNICVDVLYPPSSLADMLEAFEAQFGHVPLLVTSGVWREPVDALQKGLVELAIAPSLVGGSMRTHSTASVDFVPVVAADHPLAKLPGPVPLESLQGYRRLVLASDGHLPEEDSQRMGAMWRLDNAATRHGLLLQGVGWARLVRWQVHEDLATGRLVALEIDGWTGVRQVDLAVMMDSTRPAGPATRWLYDFLASRGR